MGWMLVVAFALCMLFGMCALPEMDCSTKGELMGFPSRYEWPSGCFVKVEGRWVPLNNYRVAE